MAIEGPELGAAAADLVEVWLTDQEEASPGLQAEWIERLADVVRSGNFGEEAGEGAATVRRLEADVENVLDLTCAFFRSAEKEGREAWSAGQLLRELLKRVPDRGDDTGPRAREGGATGVASILNPAG